MVQLPPFILFCHSKEGGNHPQLSKDNESGTEHKLEMGIVKERLKGGNMAKISKHKAPSRIKYERDHPTVSCRVSRDIYDRLVEAKAEGNSFADILKLGLGKLEVQLKKVGEARKQGWDEGYKKGYADAALRYKVSYPCSICGQIIEVTTPQEKQAINECMRQRGWAHETCIGRR